MISQMREVPPDVVQAWEGDRSDEEFPFARTMRAARLMNEARDRLMVVLPLGGGIVFGAVLGILLPMVVALMFAVLAVLVVLFQLMVWRKRCSEGRQVIENVDRGVKILDRKEA